jgi:hypothetical protein
MANDVEMDRIQAELEQLGYRMEPSLSAIDGEEGHAVVEISTGDLVDPPQGRVLDLAVAWSVLAGCIPPEGWED